MKTKTYLRAPFERQFVHIYMHVWLTMCAQTQWASLISNLIVLLMSWECMIRTPKQHTRTHCRTTVDANVNDNYFALSLCVRLYGRGACNYNTYQACYACTCLRTYIHTDGCVRVLGYYNYIRPQHSITIVLAATAQHNPHPSKCSATK